MPYLFKLNSFFFFSVKYEITTPLVSVFISEVSNTDYLTLTNEAANLKGTVHVVVRASLPDEGGQERLEKEPFIESPLYFNPSKSTSSRSVAANMHFKEYLFFPGTQRSDLPLSFELRGEEGGYRETFFGHADLVFKGSPYMGAVKFKDNQGVVVGDLHVEIRYTTFILRT